MGKLQGVLQISSPSLYIMAPDGFELNWMVSLVPVNSVAQLVHDIKAIRMSVRFFIKGYFYVYVPAKFYDF